MLRLVMEGEAVDADPGQGFDVVAGVGHHEVAVEVGVGDVLLEGGHHGRADGEVGHEVAGWGHAYPSMMSMWRESAPSYSTCWQSLLRSPKSAERMEGPMNIFLRFAIISIGYKADHDNTRFNPFSIPHSLPLCHTPHLTYEWTAILIQTHHVPATL